MIVWTMIDGFGDALGFAIALATAAVLMVTLLRWGVLAFVVAQLTDGLAWHARAADYSDWTGEGALITVAALAALALYGVWAATGRSSTPSA